MSKLNKVGYYNKVDGSEISESMFSEISKEHMRKKYIDIFYKMENYPLNLTMEEIEIIRKSEGIRNPNRVNLVYQKGFFMSSKIEECVYEELNPLTVYLLHMCGYRINKDGLLKYKNGRAIRRFKDLRDYYSLSNYKWKIIEKDIEKYKLIKSQPHDDETYLVLNPLYTSSQYEITMYKFMAFHKELEEHLTKLEFLYLCKKFDIIP